MEYLNWNRMFSSSPACCLTGVVGTWKWKQNRLWIPWFVLNQLIGWAISIMFIYGYDHFQVYIGVYCISMLASKKGCLRVPAYGLWCLFHLAHQVWDLWGSMFQATINHPIPPKLRGNFRDFLSKYHKACEFSGFHKSRMQGRGTHYARAPLERVCAQTRETRRGHSQDWRFCSLHTSTKA